MHPFASQQRRHHTAASAVVRASATAVESLESRRMLAAAISELQAEQFSQDPGVIAAIQRATDLSTYSSEQIRGATQWLIGAPTLKIAQQVARGVSATNVQAASYLRNTYILSFAGTMSGHRIADALTAEQSLSFFAPMVAKQQSPRAIPNDPSFPNQWHLRNTGQGSGVVGADANIVDVWDTYRGAGVTIGIVDDGLTTTHPDLAPNYVAAHSFDFNSNEPDPSPGSHGTSVGGVSGARGNNGVGVSGAAPEASLAGIRLIAGSVTDATEANALSYHNDDIDIYNNSWGPNDGGTVLDGPGPITLAAMADSVQNGRNGLGVIYAWAGGNGGNGDNIAYDGYANSRYVVAVGAMTNSAVRSSYSERGSALLVSAYSSGGSLGITTTSSGGYTSSFGGTSSASPLAAGVIALMLDANPNLTWRDVQHILVNSSEKVNPTDSGWSLNGAGHDINDKYGYGGIDAGAAVALAESWNNVAPEVIGGSATQTVNAAIPDGNAAGISRSVTINDPIKVESVEVVLSAAHTSRGQLRILLTSPSGTESILAEPRADTGDNYTNWIFTSKRHWDESAAGQWTVTVIDPTTGTAGTWQNFKLNVYGTLQGSGVYGSVYNDANANGSRDGGETGLAGITVFLDDDNNGGLDSGEQSTVTNSVGSYAFSGLENGTYNVRSIAPAGQRPTEPVGGGAQVAVISDLDPVSTGQNFGYVNPNIAGTVFNDADDDGVRDANEAGRAAVTVYFDTNDNGSLDGGELSTVTDASGGYRFSELADGDYVVRIIEPSGSRQTSPVDAHDVTISNASLAATGQNFGLTTTVRLQGAVFNDINANGVRDPGEDGIAGARVFLDTNNNGTFDASGGVYVSTDVPKPIADVATTFSDILVTGASTVTALTVTLNITHTWNADLDLYLVGPSGTRIELSTDNGGSGDNYTNTTFDDNAATLVSSGTSPFTGSYRPEQPLSTFFGQEANGTWRLEMVDDLSGFVGTLNSWSINLNSIEANVLTPADGSFTFPALPAGNYKLRQVPLGGGSFFTAPVSGLFDVTAGSGALFEGDFGNSTAFSSNDGFYVRLNGIGDTIQIFRNTTGAGIADFELPYATTPAVNLVGGADEDQLIVDLVNGNPIPTGGINFGGGASDDTVIVRGGTGADEVTFDGSSVETGARSINYSGTEFVVFEGGAGNDTLTYVDSTATPGFLGQGGRNLLSVVGNWTYDVDAATQNDQIDVVVGRAATLTLDSSQHLDSLTVEGQAVVTLTPVGGVIRTDALDVQAGGAVDLGSGALVLDYTGPGAALLAGLRNLLAEGYANGAWTGDGLRSSVAAGSPALDALGYATSSAVFGSFPALFMGEFVDDTTLLVRHTLGGDATLNKSVDIDDFGLLALNFNAAGGWSEGDFDYSGTVDIDDFGVLALNFNQALPAAAGRPQATPATAGPFSSKTIADDRDDERLVEALIA